MNGRPSAGERVTSLIAKNEMKNEQATNGGEAPGGKRFIETLEKRATTEKKNN